MKRRMTSSILQVSTGKSILKAKQKPEYTAWLFQESYINRRKLLEPSKTNAAVVH